MDVLRRGVGGKAAGKCRCRCRFARGRFVPYESRPGGGGGRQGGFLGGELNSKEDCADAWLAQGSTGQCSGYPELF